MALAYSRHGAWLAEGTALGHVVLRDAESGAIQGEFTGLSGQVFGLQFARDQLWASDHLGHLRRWPLKGGPLSDRVFDEPTGLGRLASTADSHFLIEAMRDGRARVRGLPDGEHVADLIQMRDGSWATWFADGTTQYSATGEVRRALFALPDRRVVQLDGTQPRLEFGETSVTRVALGAFAVRTTVFSAFGAPSLRLDGRWAIASIRPSPTVALAYDVEFFVDDPLGGSHALEATSEALGSASTTFTLGADLRKTRALVIGNEDYAASSHGVPDVPGAGSDAEAIASLFRSPTGWAMGKDQLQVLKSLPAAELRAKVTGFFKAAQRGETLLFYFAGHGLTQTRPGGKEGLLLPVDFDPAHPETGFSATELWAAIRASSAANVLLVFDACRSGAFALPADLLGAEVEAGRTSGQGPAVGLLAATHAGGSAQGTTTGGVFTQTLVQVLQSPGSVDVFSGVHTVGGAFTRLRGVPAAAAQWPRLFGSLDDLLLARPERPVESTRTTTETLAADRWLQKATFTVNELRQISVAGHRVDARADKDRNLIVKLFFGHDTDSVKISIRYPDPDPQKTLRTEGVATGGKAATEREVGILLKKDVFTTTGEHTVTVQPCRTKEQCGEEPAVTFKVTL